MADRAKFLDFLDMIDGGGAGQRGDEFKGGGIFSMLANLMPINPYGSEDPTRARARDAYYAEQGITPEQAAAIPAVIRALPYDAGPITQDMRPQRRPQPNFPNYAPPSVSSMPQQSFPNYAPPSVAPQNMVRPEVTVGGMPAAPTQIQPSVMSVGPAQPTSRGVPIGPQSQMQTSMVSGTGFQEGDMRGRIDGGILGGVTPAIAGRESFMPPEMANTMPQVSQSYKSDPQFMSVAQNDATFLSMPEAARQNIYNQYLQRRNMQ
tara:strand:- start:1700 stop:2488 length:789 start_codon:yes stop_codon:yes gene_type:complete